jgi:hypothetical protein
LRFSLNTKYCNLNCFIFFRFLPSIQVVPGVGLGVAEALGLLDHVREAHHCLVAATTATVDRREVVEDVAERPGEDALDSVNLWLSNISPGGIIFFR